MILSRFKLVAFPETLKIGFYTKTLFPSQTALESVTVPPVPPVLACVSVSGGPRCRLLLVSSDDEQLSGHR